MLHIRHQYHFWRKNAEILKGVQQGDILGPFLFSLGIQDIVNKLKSELDVFYLDDGTLGGKIETGLEDLGKIKATLISHGLELNSNKCKLFLVNPTNLQYERNCFNEVCNGIKIVEKHELSLLGAPIFSEAIRSVSEPKIDNLKLMTSRFKEIDNHEALFLSRHCFAIPKLTHFLRTSPCFIVGSMLKNFDKKDSLVYILNISLSESAFQHTANLFTA